MNKVPKICITLIGVSLMMFYGAFFYYMDFKGGEDALSRTMSGITSAISTKDDYAGPTMVAGSSGWTEERSVIAIMWWAVALSLVSIFISSYQRVKAGPYKLFVPLVFGAATVIGCILYTAYRYRLDQYA